MSRLRAFTIVELLFVVAVLAVLVSLLLAALQKARRVADQIKFPSNLKQVGNAVYLWDW